ncbi:hypothetical protein UFOVP410_127 [uncultured Caudovirales phage]|uniref:Uncharacterized protein n=1 Tax=uncultured Caudovirales phage TaxID=2100421 RepID=A0A6J5M3V0_9CAUD|nr:hypothetical protein UFOVP410_127 [uncultured Caudovirales phage]
MKHSSAQLMQDLKPALKAWLIAIHKSNTGMFIRLRKETDNRVAFAKYINKHYAVKAQLHDADSVYIQFKNKK